MPMFRIIQFDILIQAVTRSKHLYHHSAFLVKIQRRGIASPIPSSDLQRRLGKPQLLILDRLH